MSHLVLVVKEDISNDTNEDYSDEIWKEVRLSFRSINNVILLFPAIFWRKIWQAYVSELKNQKIQQWSLGGYSNTFANVREHHCIQLLPLPFCFPFLAFLARNFIFTLGHQALKKGNFSNAASKKIKGNGYRKMPPWPRSNKCHCS